MASGELKPTRLTQRQRLKNIHGLLNAVGWGIVIPLGIMSARYLRPFPSANPAWFYLHVLIQLSGYAAGVAGWAIGLKLAAESKSDKLHEKHRYIGYAIFAGGTLQVLALLVRPKPYDKIRFYWNLYHHSVGYATLALALVNIFIGLDILKPVKKWRTIFIAVLFTLAAVSLIAEIITWIRYFRRRYLLKIAAANAAAVAAAAAARAPQKFERSFLDRMFGRTARPANIQKQRSRSSRV